MPALTVCPGEELSLSAFASRLEGADGDTEAAAAARAAMEANLNRHSAAAAQKENVQVMLPPLQLSLQKKTCGNLFYSNQGQELAIGLFDECSPADRDEAKCDLVDLLLALERSSWHRAETTALYVPMEKSACNCNNCNKEYISHRNFIVEVMASGSTSNLTRRLREFLASSQDFQRELEGDREPQQLFCFLRINTLSP